VKITFIENHLEESLPKEIIIQEGIIEIPDDEWYHVSSNNQPPLDTEVYRLPDGRALGKTLDEWWGNGYPAGSLWIHPSGYREACETDKYSSEIYPEEYTFQRYRDGQEVKKDIPIPGKSLGRDRYLGLYQD
jgi:hypothetical protein